MKIEMEAKYSEEDNCFVARVIRHPTDRFRFIGSHGDTPEEALAQLCAVINFVLNENSA